MLSITLEYIIIHNLKACISLLYHHLVTSHEYLDALSSGEEEEGDYTLHEDMTLSDLQLTGEEDDSDFTYSPVILDLKARM